MSVVSMVCLIVACYCAIGKTVPFLDRSTEIQQEINRRVQWGYNRHIAVGRLTEKTSEFYGGGDFLFPVEGAIFEIGSMTKLFTAHLSLILCQEGLISLDEPVESYLLFALPSYEGKKVTLRHLLTHTSGLQDPPTENYYNEATGNTVVFAEYSLVDLHNYLNQTALRFPPGTHILYSNLAYGLMGHVLEVVSGKKYFTLLREKILEPLGMNQTFLEVPSDFSLKLIVGSEGGELRPAWKILHFPAFGALKSTVKDLALYLRAFFFDSAFPKEMVQQLTAPFLQCDQLPFTATLGWSIDRRGQEALYVASGQTLGFSSFMGFSPTQREGIILLTDASQLDLLGHHWLDSNFPDHPLYQTIPLSSEKLHRFSGIYRSEDGRMRVSVKVRSDHLELAADKERPIALYPAAENLFFSKYLHPSHELLCFVFEEDFPKELTIGRIHFKKEADE